MQIALAKRALAAVLLLLIRWVSAQAAQCAPDSSPQLRFVAQLNVSGCALLVHDTGANDGPHLAVEPIMCVTESLHKVAPRYDFITQQAYVSVPVTLRDDAMLEEAQRQLRHLSPKSVKFATVFDISVSSDNSSTFQALEFIWTPDESIGFLRLGCRSPGEQCSTCNLSSSFQRSQFEALDQLVLLAKLISNDTILNITYRLTIQNESFLEPAFHVSRFLPECQQLRFARSVLLNNCTARVHQRLDLKGNFLIEPLLCHNVTNMSKESVMYDYSRNMHYLKLDVVLQDDRVVDAVRTQLADLSPRSVTFMRLWRAQSQVASALSRRFVIGPLMVSSDGRSAQLRVYCKTEIDCNILKSTAMASPVDLWKQVKYLVTSMISDRCLLNSGEPKHPWRMQDGYRAETDPICNRIEAEPQTATTSKYTRPQSERSGPASDRPPQIQATNKVRVPQRKNPVSTADGRQFRMIQQRLTCAVSFERTWAEYETGFGDETNFWIGLSAIHSLSKNGATLRVEMKLWNGTELHAEYAGFKVEDASTKYRMTYREMLSDRSSVSFDAMAFHNGMQFSTLDSDNDLYSGGSCSNIYGRGGWWFNSCHRSNPNGRYPTGDASDDRSCSWFMPSIEYANLREVRLMLQI